MKKSKFKKKGPNHNNENGPGGPKMGGGEVQLKSPQQFGCLL